MARATIKDVAREAGVSLSTVNKALTGKKGISSETKNRILAVAQKLQYRVNPLAGSLARNVIRIGVVVPEDWQEYYQDICDGITYEMERFVNWKVEGITQKFSIRGSGADEQALACVRLLHAQGIRAVILCHGSYLTYDRTLAYAAQEKIDVICVGIGLRQEQPCLATIEVDGRKCGRVAAEVLEQSLPEGAAVAVIIGSAAVLPHREKVLGFSDRLAQGGKLRYAGFFESGDQENTAFQITQKLLQEKRVQGIFVATGVVDGVCRAITEAGLAGRIKVIATDLTRSCLRYLHDHTIGFTIYQNTFLQGVMAVDMFYRYFAEGITPPVQSVVPPVLFTKESLLEQGKRCLYTDVLAY